MAVHISSARPTVNVPATLYLLADGGGHEAVPFTVEFRRCSTSERDELNARWIAGELKLPELLDALVCGWAGLYDQAGQPVPYSHTERRAADESYSGLEQAMAVAWFDHAFINQRQAALKNCAAPSATGLAQTAQQTGPSTTN